LINLDRERVKTAVVGGAILGGGGGGWIELGLASGYLAVEMDRLTLLSPDELPDDTAVVTVGAVGAPAAKDRYVTPRHFIRAVELLRDRMGVAVGGLITNENGGSATVNGWIQAAALGLPVVDAPCNGRAHPTGLMGSMGLHRRTGYLSIQAAAGGDPQKGRYLEMTVTGGLSQASALVRQSSIQAGGVLAVARNPVTLSYARENGAPGAISEAMRVGSALLKHEGDPARMIRSAAEALRGELIAEGVIADVSLQTEGGFDSGRVRLSTGHELTFWNEYMTLEKDGERLGTFPDLIMTFDLGSGMPVISAEIEHGQPVAVIWSHRSNLILGAGMKDPALFVDAERAVNRSIIQYVF